MHTQSTPLNQLVGLFASDAMSASRPSLPLSSMPSKQKRRLTGSGSPSAVCASSTFTQPKIGPLSSVEPRPISCPFSALTVSVNGSVSHPSDLFACACARAPVRQRRPDTERARASTHRLHVKVAVDQHGLLRRVVADPAEQRGRERERRAVHDVRAEVDGARLDAVLLQRILEIRAHPEHLVPALGLAGDAGAIAHSDQPRVCCAMERARQHLGMATASPRRWMKLSACESTY